MDGTETKGGEGYLVEDRKTAEALFCDFLRKGFQGLYLFSGSPHFSFGDVYFIRLDGCSLSTVGRKVDGLIQDKKSIIFIEGILSRMEKSKDALPFLSLLKDNACLAGSSVIVFLEGLNAGDEQFRLVLEKEFTKV